MMLAVAAKCKASPAATNSHVGAGEPAKAASVAAAETVITPAPPRTKMSGLLAALGGCCWEPKELSGCASAAAVERASAKAPTRPDLIRLRFIIVLHSQGLGMRPLS
jgi:hypothetical protein